MLSWSRPGRGAEAKSSRADVPRSFGGPSERCSRIFRRSRRWQFSPRRLGGLVNTGPLSSEESGGALSRSTALFAFSRPASFPARHSFLRITIDHGYSWRMLQLAGFRIAMHKPRKLKHAPL